LISARERMGRSLRVLRPEVVPEVAGHPLDDVPELELGEVVRPRMPLLSWKLL